MDEDPEGFGPPASRKRSSVTLFFCGTVWVAALLVELRVGDGMTWGYFLRMTLVVAAVAIPMMLVEDRTLWETPRRRIAGFGAGAAAGWALAALLYLLVIVALFSFMNEFW